MKVERKAAEPTFVPIVLTLESEAEARMAWHMMNNNGYWDDYRRNHNVPEVSVKDAMWRALDKLYRPKDEDC